MFSKRTVRVLVITWSSFLTAAVATMVFFAAFDPTEVALAATFPMELSRMAGYAIGFAGFWALAAGTAWLATFLLRHDA